MPIVFLAVFAVYFAGCYYIARKVARVCPSTLVRRSVYGCVVVLTLMFPLQHLLSPYAAEWVIRAAYLVSSLWLIVVLYATIMFVLIDFARFIAKKRNGTVPPESVSSIWNTAVIVAIVLVCGLVNAYTPGVSRYSVHSDKVAVGDTIKIVLVSDIHMGYGVRGGDVERMVRMVNSQDADFCFVSGDLFDGDVAPVVNGDLGAAMRNIKTRRGVYAVLGNHEYIGDVDVAVEYMKSLNINVLRDSAMAVSLTSFDMPPYVWIIGRDDRSAARVGIQCKSLSQMDNDTCQIKIVVDHQPSRIDESVSVGADLHLSGHTHAGQVWPMRMFTSLLYDVDYGHEKIGSTDVVVSSGYGSWGPRVRLASTSEIVVIEMTR